MRKETKIAIIGLGYVGLPLAVEFGKKFPTIGFDINTSRVQELKEGRDSTMEVSPKELKHSTGLQYTTEPKDIASYNTYIITVPTPVDHHKSPDLTALIESSRTIGKLLDPGDLVIYESTVYPGATEEVCVPILEHQSGLKFNQGFFCGYSPERINPGDKKHRLPTIKKITSGSTPETADKVDALYRSIITAGTHKTSCIKVAEAAKVIENTQRDLNIALMNELALIFDLQNINTTEVLEAAGTKWNFLPFKPGLVGGHCIGVDPYYLTYKAEMLGYHPRVILAGRTINDDMGKVIAQRTIREMIHAQHSIHDSTVTILGMTFKENCPDIRNSKVIDIINELKKFSVRIQVSDPYADSKEVEKNYGTHLIPFEKLKPSTAVIIAVAHEFYCNLLPIDYRNLMLSKPVLIDVKGIISKQMESVTDMKVWRL
ncbi:MAG: Vi polysaccharide biosynthesis protein VipA/TviB [SAR324 cluster bacterium]|uniref:Vi polysaccharide biosynthesis protein VipA/TviB n=1 Tax=SAR324 cluster bacterium TaxID=2024889 RepID=A0A2A4T223_9DELT|nr:MAG: Vi polysaccharide biosynthesis protein VipA/TviB [SAR324 cluster bacterium]